MNVNDIAAEIREGLLIRPSKKASTGLQVASAASAELLNLGFAADPNELTGFTVPSLEKIIQAAKLVVGADREYKPMYPGFPSQVMEMSDIQLFFNAIMHYFSSGTWLPETEVYTRLGMSLTDRVEPKILKVIKLSDWGIRLFLSLNVTPGANDVDSWKSWVNRQNNQGKLVKLFEDTKFNNGEVFGYVVLSMAEKLGKPQAFTLACTKTWNPDYLLRAFMICFTDVPMNNILSLVVPKMKIRTRIPRSSRVELINTLGRYNKGGTHYLLDRVYQRKNLWRQLLRPVHPYNVKGHSEARGVLDIIHGNSEYETTNALVERLITEGDTIGAATLLSPGSLLRRLVHLSRISQLPQLVTLVDIVKDKCTSASLATLISAYNSVNREDGDHSVLRVAGRRNIVREISSLGEDRRDLLSAALISIIESKLGTLPAPKVVNVGGVTGVTPINTRDLSSSSISLPRGSRTLLVDGDRNFGEDSVLRMFVHWKNNREHTDVDLNVNILNDDYDSIDFCNYTMMRSRGLIHSGDITNAPGSGAAEFVDVTIPALSVDSRFAVMSLIVYSGDKFNELNCVAGVQFRDNRHAGEIFEPRTVVTASQPQVDSTLSVPLMVDLNTMEMVWLDTTDGTQKGYYSSDTIAFRSLLQAENFDGQLQARELLEMWAAANGSMVSEEKGDYADVVMLVNKL